MYLIFVRSHRSTIRPQRPTIRPHKLTVWPQRRPSSPRGQLFGPRNRPPSSENESLDTETDYSAPETDHAVPETDRSAPKTNCLPKRPFVWLRNRLFGPRNRPCGSWDCPAPVTDHSAPESDFRPRDHLCDQETDCLAPEIDRPIPKTDWLSAPRDWLPPPKKIGAKNIQRHWIKVRCCEWLHWCWYVLALAGLVTFSDGSNGLPRQEGKFECGKLISPCECSAQVSKAQEAAATACQM